MVFCLKTNIYAKFPNFKELVGNLQGSYSKIKAYIVIKILQRSCGCMDLKMTSVRRTLVTTYSGPENLKKVQAKNLIELNESILRNYILIFFSF